jgi:hypothetical protein
MGRCYGEGEDAARMAELGAQWTPETQDDNED